MGSSGKDAVRDAKNAANAQMTEQKAMQASARASVEKQKQEYKSFNFENPYANMENQYANMENVYEDLTVNQQQAQFQAQQGGQQRANIMQSLRGAAGSSGIAGLAQSMANQGQLQAQQISASIGAQESANQRLTAQGAGAIQQAERAGAAAVDMQQRQGEGMVQQAESGRISTLLGMEYGELQGAQAGVQSAYGAQQSAMAMEMERINANKALTGDIIGGVTDIATSFIKPRI
jgi:hypothetical protein